MISGIMPCSRWIETGYPFKQVLRSWQDVCDEIIIVANRIHEVSQICSMVRDVRVTPYIVTRPPLDSFAGYGTYLMIGLFYCHEPDWVIPIEADFLISPENGVALRKELNDAPAESEIVLTDVMSLNYAGTMMLYQQEFEKFFPPFDGHTWHRPIGCRPKRGIFPVPYEGIDARGIGVNCEGFISMQPGKWGMSFNSKTMNNNPRNFNLLRLHIPIEHLTWTRSPRAVKYKISHPHWHYNSLTIENVITGSKPMPYTYPELKSVQDEYGALVPELQAVMDEQEVRVESNEDAFL